MLVQIDRLKKEFAADKTFLARDVCQYLQVSRQTVQRIVDWGLEHGRIERVGTGRNTHYKMTG